MYINCHDKFYYEASLNCLFHHKTDNIHNYVMIIKYGTKWRLEIKLLATTKSVSDIIRKCGSIGLEDTDLNFCLYTVFNHREMNPVTKPPDLLQMNNWGCWTGILSFCLCSGLPSEMFIQPNFHVYCTCMLNASCLISTDVVTLMIWIYDFGWNPWHCLIYSGTVSALISGTQNLYMKSEHRFYNIFILWSF